MNKNPFNPSQDNVYVGYQSALMQIAVASAQVPPDFTINRPSGRATTGGWNAAHRIAVDRSSGAVYSLWETAGNLQCSSGSAIRYSLNRSTNGGLTWGTQWQRYRHRRSRSLQ